MINAAVLETRWNLPVASSKIIQSSMSLTFLNSRDTAFSVKERSEPADLSKANGDDDDCHYHYGIGAPRSLYPRPHEGARGRHSSTHRYTNPPGKPRSGNRPEHALPSGLEPRQPQPVPKRCQPQQQLHQGSAQFCGSLFSS